MPTLIAIKETSFAGKLMEFMLEYLLKKKLIAIGNYILLLKHRSKTQEFQLMLVLLHSVGIIKLVQITI